MEEGGAEMCFCARPRSLVVLYFLLGELVLDVGGSRLEAAEAVVVVSLLLEALTFQGGREKF